MDALKLHKKEIAALLQCAIRTSRKAGLHAYRNFKRRSDVWRAFAHDVKLKLDRECQALAFAEIRRQFRDHAILGEESGLSDLNASDILWVIDPIDGTLNFSHGLPLWCCSVAALCRGQSVAASVFAPVLDECYTASLHDRSRCNGRPIAVSTTRRLRNALVATGLDENADNYPRSFRLLNRLCPRTQKVRIMGSAAIDICHVACGRAEGYYESGIFLWDVAAAGLIVEQAGGRSEFLERLDGYRIRFMTTNGLIHGALKREIEANHRKGV
ncbi:MAG: inositol monophosphatase [Lentisphaerae bacterium]|nr:inositol monophosphatase [Lentisphaerota bacterium]